MTEFVIELLRLRGDEQWSEWGDGWWDHAERLGALPREGPGGWELIDYFRQKHVRGTKLDWGALLYPVSKGELTMLYPATIELSAPSPSRDTPRLEISELPADDQYGLVVIECA